MKSWYALALSLMLPWPALAAEAAAQPWRVAALDAACMQKCEQARDGCLAQYTVSDSSGRYVTPEGVKVCYAAFHDCKKSCTR